MSLYPAGRTSRWEHLSLIENSLTPGRLADMVVPGKNPRETDPDEIGAIEAGMTIVNGKIIYNAESA